jgi:hypothetical protein
MALKKGDVGLKFFFMGLTFGEISIIDWTGFTNVNNLTLSEFGRDFYC